jgi:hypothetical protein
LTEDVELENYNQIELKKDEEDAKFEIGSINSF